MANISKILDYSQQLLLMFFPFVVVIAAGCARDDLSSVLTSGQWVKDIGSGALHEEYVYDFAKDGTYTLKLFTDHTIPTIAGHWELVPVDDGTVHLKLRAQYVINGYYWLGQDSAVKFDADKDELVISGRQYDGEQRLRHQKP